MTISIIDRLNHLAQGGWFNFLLNLFAGASIVLAFAPFGYWYLIFPGLVWFILPLKELSVRQTFFRSLYFNTGFYGAGISWIYISIYQFSDTPLVISLVMMALFVVFLALLASISMVLLNRYCNRMSSNYYYLVAFPFAWLCSEWFFNWVLTGFPWLGLGYSQIDSYLSSVAPVLGASAISFLIVFMSGSAAVFIRKGYKQALHIPVILTIIFVGVTYLSQLQWGQLTDKTLEVSLIQPNVSQHKKWLPEQRRVTLEYFYATTENLDSELIIWPEGAVPALARRVENYLSLINALAWDNNQAVITGIATKDNDKYYNTALMLGNGQGKYYKQRLVPFGEYVPFEAMLRGIIGFFDLPMSSFSKGPQGQNLLNTSDWQIAMVLCYEIIFQDVVHNQLQDAELMVNLSNDAWFGDSIGPYQHLAITRMRAVENGIPIIRATNDGISAFIDHKGNVTHSMGKFKKGVLTTEITAVSGYTPYRQLGPVWSYVIILLIPGVILLMLLIKNRSRDINS